MRTRLFVSLAALALLISVPSGANAVGQAMRRHSSAAVRPRRILQFQARVSGKGDQQGTCAATPKICNKIFRQVCGCDNKTYANDCERQAAGVSKLHDGKCKKAAY